MKKQTIFIIILIIVLILIIINISKEKFEDLEKLYNKIYDFNYEKNKLLNIQTSPNLIISALSPTPIYNCTDIKEENKCLESGCNWFGTYCSAMYPSLL